MFDLMTFEDTPNAISSPALEYGRTASDSPDGPTIDPSGPAVARASLSARQAKEAGLMTSGTFGRTGTISSESAALQSSLASRLQARTASAGSILYKLTWKERDTPAGRSIPALRASAWSGKKAKPGNGYEGPFTIALIPGSQPNLAILPIELLETLAKVGITSDSDSASSLSGWTTTTTRDWKDSGADITPRSDNGKQRFDQLPRQANLCGWPTARAAEAGPDFAIVDRPNSGGLSLPHVATMAGWPTAMAGTPAQKGYNEAGNTDSSRKTVALCKVEGPIRATATGDLLTGSTAGMESGGQLDPAHSRWLMELPPAWDACAPMAMRSTRKPRDSSSKRTSKRSSRTTVFSSDALIEWLLAA